MKGGISEMERKEKIRESIKETQTIINNIEIVIQGLESVKKQAKRIDEKTDIQKLIDQKTKEIDFLCDLRENDEATLSIL